MLLTVAGCSIGKEPPEVMVKINDETIETSKDTYGKHRVFYLKR
jgi:hypothetical protein